MFRKLYWVVEERDGAGYRVSGVYTSVPDLIDNGLVSSDVRISLVPLDKRDAHIGTYEGIMSVVSDLRRLVEEKYLRDDEGRMLLDASSKI